VGFSHLYVAINLQYSSCQEKSKSCLISWLSCQIAVLIIKASDNNKLLKVYLKICQIFEILTVMWLKIQVF